MFLFKNFITRPFLSMVVFFAGAHILIFLLEYDAFMTMILVMAGVSSLVIKTLDDLGW